MKPMGFYQFSRSSRTRIVLINVLTISFLNTFILCWFPCHLDGFCRITVFKSKITLRWSVLVTVLIKHCIKDFGLSFSWNLCRSFGKFIIISFVNIIFLVICHLTFINFRSLSFLHDSRFIIFSITITALVVEIILIFSSKSISKKILIFLI